MSAFIFSSYHVHRLLSTFLYKLYHQITHLTGIETGENITAFKFPAEDYIYAFIPQPGCLLRQIIYLEIKTVNSLASPGQTLSIK